MRDRVKRIHLVLAVIALILLATAQPAVATVTYTITDLGTLGGSWSRALGINDLGQVVVGEVVRLYNLTIGNK